MRHAIWKGAIKDYEAALALAVEIGDRSVHAAMEVNLGVLHANLGNADPALEHLTNGLNLSQQGNLRNHELKAQLAIAKLTMRLSYRNSIRLGAQGAKEYDAERHLDAAEELVERVGSAGARFHLPLILSARAELRLLMGHIEEAMTLAEKSVALAVEQDKHVDLAICQRVKGQVLMARGEYQQAATLLEQSLPPLEGRHRFEAAKTKVLLGQSLRKLGDPVRCDELIAEARAIFTAIDAKFELADLASDKVRE